MPISKYFFLLFIFLLTVACGKKEHATKVRHTPIREEQIPFNLNHQKFECASVSGQCPAGIARLFIVNPTNPQRSSVCSGFMISPRRLVTNHHCLSSYLQCQATFVAIYTGHQYQKSRCHNIVRTEEDVSDPDDPSRKIDYTILEIEGVYAGNFFPLSRQLASPGDTLDVWVIDHTGLDKMPSNLNDSRITQLHCQVGNQNTYQSLLALRCPIISGNSGSPALNQQGEVVAVAWGGTANHIDSRYPLPLRRQLRNVALMTEVNYFMD